MRKTVVVLLLLLIVPVSVWSAAKKQKTVEDPAAWYSFGYDSKKCALQDPLSWMDFLNMTGQRYTKKEVENDGKVTRVTLSHLTEYGPKPISL